MKTKTKISSFFGAFLTASFLFSSINLQAQDGSLDLSFDGDGKVLTGIGPTADYGQSVAIQSDGKIVVAGISNNGVKTDFAVARYNTDGSLDNTFSSDGKVSTSIGNVEDKAYAVAIQSDGKIVVAGFSHNGFNNDFAIVRYNTDGSLDLSFSSDGKASVNFGAGTETCYAVAIQSDGKIVTAGYNDNGPGTDFALARFNANGSLDLSFSSDGKVTTAIGTSSDNGYSIAIQPDGKILVAGTSWNGTNGDFAIVRYNTTGTLDNTFDNDGKATTAVGSGGEIIYSIALQSDGKILAAGYSFNGSDNDFAVVRYNSNGTLDNTFDTDGKATTSIGNNSDIAYAIAMQMDGKIVLAGASDNGTNDDFALVRYNTNGSLDLSFNGSGKVTTFVGNDEDYASAIAIQSNGKIVAVGSNFNGSDYDFALTRYNSSIVGIEKISNNLIKLTTFPNPFNSSTMIEFQSNEPISNAILTIYNSLGEEVKTIANISQPRITLYRDGLSNGIYLMNLSQDKKVIATGKLVITD